MAAADQGTLDDPLEEGLLGGSTNFRQAWGLDPVGDWDTFKWDSNGSDPWDASQTRQHNKVNEITSISDGIADWIDPTWDARGNMITGPKPGAETTRLHFR